MNECACACFEIHWVETYNNKLISHSPCLSHTKPVPQATVQCTAYIYCVRAAVINNVKERTRKKSFCWFTSAHTHSSLSLAKSVKYKRKILYIVKTFSSQWVDRQSIVYLQRKQSCLLNCVLRRIEIYFSFLSFCFWSFLFLPFFYPTKKKKELFESTYIRRKETDSNLKWIGQIVVEHSNRVLLNETICSSLWIYNCTSGAANWKKKQEKKKNRK